MALNRLITELQTGLHQLWCHRRLFGNRFCQEIVNSELQFPTVVLTDVWQGRRNVNSECLSVGVPPPVHSPKSVGYDQLMLEGPFTVVLAAKHILDPNPHFEESE